MADGGFDESGRHRGKRRTKRQRKNRKIDKLMFDLKWLFGGLAIGLPLLALLIYALSRV